MSEKGPVFAQYKVSTEHFFKAWAFSVPTRVTATAVELFLVTVRSEFNFTIEPKLLLLKKFISEKVIQYNNGLAKLRWEAGKGKSFKWFFLENISAKCMRSFYLAVPVTASQEVA